MGIEAPLCNFLSPYFRKWVLRRRGSDGVAVRSHGVTDTYQCTNRLWSRYRQAGAANCIAWSVVWEPPVSSSSALEEATSLIRIR